MNNFLLTLAPIIVFALAALFAVPPFIDWNAYRGVFEEEVSRLMDREVRVEGRVNVRLLPVPFVSFEKVRVADETGIAGSFVRADQFNMWLAVPPLLRGIIEARQIELEKPVLRLRIAEDGTGNWQSLRIRDTGLAFLPRDVALNSVVIDDGTVVFEHHTGTEITRLSKLSGELSAAALRGPYKFVGSASAGAAVQEVRFSTAPLEPDGNIRFRSTVRQTDAGLNHTIDGSINQPLGRSHIEGRLRTESIEPRRTAAGREAGAFEMTSKIFLDGDAFRLEDFAITFENKDRLQTLTGSALTSWQNGLVTRTELRAPWLDLDTVAGTRLGDSPLMAVERLLTRGLEPLGTGVTSVELNIDQGRLAGATLSGLRARLVRRHGVTKVENLYVSLPGLTALALEGFVDSADSKLQFDGNIVLRSANLAEFAQWLRADAGWLAEELSGPFALNGSLRIRPKRIAISDARASIAGERVEGILAYDTTNDRPVILANFDAASFDLRRLGAGLLEPRLLAAKLGFAVPRGDGSRDGADLRRMFAGIDMMIKLRANKLTDGERTFKNLKADIQRVGDRLTIKRLDLDWEPGLELRLGGELDAVGKATNGKLGGTVAADGKPAARRLADLLSLMLGNEVPEGFVADRAPLRFALDATLGAVVAGTAQAPGKNVDAGYPTVVIADGTTQGGRLRLTARTAGPLDNWREQGTHLEAHLTGPRPLRVARWLIGKTDETGSGVTGGDGDKVTAGAKMPPATVVLSAVGVPTRGMKAAAHYGAGELLDVDFAGSLQVVTAGPLAARWSGRLGFNRADTVVLSDLFWPTFAKRIEKMPIKGSIEVAGGTGKLTIRSDSLQLAGSLVRTNLEVSGATSLTGSLGVSKMPMGALAAFILDGGTASATAPDSRLAEMGAETALATPWPNARFDFSHLTGLSADLQLEVDRLLDSSGNTLARDLSTGMELTDKRVTLNALGVRLSEGRGTGRVELVRTPAGTAVSAHIKAGGLPLATFAPGLEAGGRLAGHAELTAEIAGRALSPAALAGVLKGSGRLVLREARVPGLTGGAITKLAGKVVAGEEEADGLGERLIERARVSAINLGAQTLDFTIRNGIVNIPTIVVGDEQGSARNATVVSLRDWRLESRWTVIPAPLPKPEAQGQTLTLPPVTLIYAGALDKLDQMEPEFSLSDLEREIVVAKMEANVARLERLRREDEERARQEAERQRLREEEVRQAREAERLRLERERAEGLRPGRDGGWQYRVKPERREPLDTPQRSAPSPRPL